MARLEWFGDEVSRNIHKGAERGLSAAAITFQGELKKMLSQAGSGKWYKGNRARSSNEGPPGEPPVSQMGELRRRIQVDLRKLRKLLARVGTNVKYAPWLELGTSRMRPRPYMKPTMRLMRARFRRIMDKWIQAAIRTA